MDTTINVQVKYDMLDSVRQVSEESKYEIEPALQNTPKDLPPTVEENYPNSENSRVNLAGRQHPNLIMIWKKRLTASLTFNASTSFSTSAEDGSLQMSNWITVFGKLRRREDHGAPAWN